MGAQHSPVIDVDYRLQQLYLRFPRTLQVLHATYEVETGNFLQQLQQSRRHNIEQALRQFIKTLDGAVQLHLTDVVRWEKQELPNAPVFNKPVHDRASRIAAMQQSEILQQYTPAQLLDLCYTLSENVVLSKSKWDWSYGNILQLDNLQQPAGEVCILRQHIYYGLETFVLEGAAILLYEMKQPTHAGTLLEQVLPYLNTNPAAFEAAFCDMLLYYTHYGVLRVDQSI